jgi:DNA-binding FadR family transcriptional regulator
MFSKIPRPELIHGVFELRTVVEPAAASLAATRRKQHHLDRMRQALDDMTRHTLEKRQRVAKQTRQFHAALLGATGNPFIVSLINGVTAAVDALTQFKQRLAKITRDPVPDHLRVYDAIAAKDQEAARSAMIELIRLAVLDMPVKQRPKPL